MAKDKRNIAFTQCFYVWNRSGYVKDQEEPGPAVLEIGAHGFGEVIDGVLQPHLTCHLMADGEIDYEINEMIKQLEEVRRKAKAMLVKHRADEKVRWRKK
jgi:hypothetical protein